MSFISDQNTCPECDACPMHSAVRASGTGHIKIQFAYIGFVSFHSQKSMRAY